MAPPRLLGCITASWSVEYVFCRTYFCSFFLIIIVTPINSLVRETVLQLSTEARFRQTLSAVAWPIQKKYHFLVQPTNISDFFEAWPFKQLCTKDTAISHQYMEQHALFFIWCRPNTLKYYIFLDLHARSIKQRLISILLLILLLNNDFIRTKYVSKENSMGRSYQKSSMHKF